MKTLQNNFTTPEQSKRLLELGVPADSADCYLQNESQDPLAYVNYTTHIIQPFHDKKIMFSQQEDFLPCWSVGRLIEIFLICAPDNYDLFYPIISPLGMKFPSIEGYRKLLQEGRVIDTIIEEIEERKQENTIYFSELEE